MAAEVATGGTPTILVVDDDASIGTILKAALGGFGFRTLCAPTGREALETLATHPVDLVVLDLMLPDMDGYAVCRAVKEDPRYDALPVLMLTGRDAVRDKVRGLESGADDYVTKPCSKEELVARIRVLLRLRRMAEELRRRSQRLAALNSMIGELTATLEIPRLFDVVVDHARALLGGEAAVLCLAAPGGQILQRAWSGVDTAWPVPPGARREDAAVEIPGAQWASVAVGEAERACAAAVREPFRASWLAVPLRRGNAAVGSLGVGHRAPAQFHVGDADLLAALASQGMAAIENARLFAQVRRLAILDDLTGLSNRRHFFERLGQELRRSQRYGRPLSLVMLDIDRFKDYNDRYGHLAGDEVLRRVGEILRRHCRDVDVAARYGGDEFGLILPETDAGAAARQAERIRDAVARNPFPAGGPEEVVDLTVSAGVAVVTEIMRKPEDMIRAADEALYRAKAAGRNYLSVAPEPA
jgi:two-component system cell cycle response regulator